VRDSFPLTLRFPHPLTLLVSCLLIAAAATWLLPAGKFDRREDAATGRSVVVAGSYHAVAPSPVTPFQAVVAIPKGMADAAAVIFYVFLVGGAFAVVEKTGASTRLVHALVDRLAGRGLLVIPIASIAFGMGGILIQMQEELIAFVPVLLLLCRTLQFPPLVACAMSLGAAAVGAAFSPVNPFQVVIAQKLAELPPQSGLGFRLAFLVPAMAIWIWGTMSYARRGRAAIRLAVSEPASVSGSAESAARSRAPVGVSDRLILASVLGAFALFIIGAQRWGWDFEQFGALFFLMGVTAGLLGGLGIGETAEGFVDGFRSMAYAGLLIGFARGIFVVLDQGQVIDTVVQGIFTPLGQLPVAVSAVGMMLTQSLIHLPVPSTSGQAVLTMPVLVPLSDLLGLPRQVTVLAYQYGAGLCELLTPTNGALMAMLAATGIGYEEWMRFSGRLLLLLALLATGGIMLGLSIFR